MSPTSETEIANAARWKTDSRARATGPLTMRLVIQRVTSARVEVDGGTVGAIDRPGLVILVGATHDDQPTTADRLAEKVWTLRILDGERSCQEENAPVLVVSQFTLYADTRKGRRPSWSAAAPRAVSEPLIEAFVSALRLRGAEVATGVFGAHMKVTLTNDGPVTLILDSAGGAP
jgi:D-aminoacyl-tRNA deacylase